MITSQSFLRDLKQTPKDKPSFWETDKETILSPFKITEGGWGSVQGHISCSIPS